MASIISPKADVSPKAKIGDNCRIYPFVYIEDDVEIGDNCVIYPFVSILNGTRMGSGNKVFQGAVIAALPQDFNFTGEESHVVIGDNNTIRENVVINRGTHAGGKTVVGNKCVFGYGTKIAGDCEIGDSVIFSTSVIENAKTRVGDMAMIQAGTSFSKDVPPYILAGGKPVAYGGPNNVIMEAAGIDEKVRKHVANAYRLVFHGQTSLFDAINQIKDQVPDGAEVRKVVEFLSQSKAGIITKI